MDDNGIRIGDFEVLLDVHDGLAAVVHESGWLDKDDLAVADDPSGYVATEVLLFNPSWKLMLLGKVVQAGKTYIVTRGFVLLTDIAQANK